jgi:DNA-directed RNA polymerase specialized sigma24 family protein
MKNWLFKFAWNNYWRVASWYDLDDMVQDGYLVFYRVLEKYRGKVQNRAHLMRLFQVSYANHIHNISIKRTRTPEVLFEDLAPNPEVRERIMDKVLQSNDDAEMALVLAGAPREVRAVIAGLEAADGATLRKPYQRRKGQRETQNERLCKLGGLDPNTVDVVLALKTYLVNT